MFFCIIFYLKVVMTDKATFVPLMYTEVTERSIRKINNWMFIQNPQKKKNILSAATWTQFLTCLTSFTSFPPNKDWTDFSFSLSLYDMRLKSFIIAYLSVVMLRVFILGSRKITPLWLFIHALHERFGPNAAFTCSSDGPVSRVEKSFFWLWGVHEL